MAKRHHQSKKSRMHEERGEERHLRDGRHMYEPSERMMEERSGAMLHEDRRAVANMPQDVKYHEWPGRRPYLDMSLDDTISGIDRQQDEDVMIARRHKSKSMY